MARLSLLKRHRVSTKRKDSIQNLVQVHREMMDAKEKSQGKDSIRHREYLERKRLEKEKKAEIPRYDWMVYGLYCKQLSVAICNKLAIRESPGKGYGVFATELIPKGTVIDYYRGRVMSKKEYKKKIKGYKRSYTIFLGFSKDIYAINGDPLLPKTNKQLIEKKLDVPNDQIGVGPLINHCCDPNVSFDSNLMYSKSWQDLIKIVAIKTIYTGRELFADYGFDTLTINDELPKGSIQCNCPTRKCRHMWMD